MSDVGPPLRDRALIAWPQRTSLASGALFLGAALLYLAVATQFALNPLSDLVLPLYGAPAQVAAAVLFLAACIISAVGISREAGFTGSLPFGKLALLIAGGEGVVTQTLAFAFAGAAEPTPIMRATQFALTIIFLAAWLASGVQVARARVLHGAARWAFLLVACGKIAAILIFGSPVVGFVAPFLAGVPLEYGDTLTALVLGTSLILWGRVEALRYRSEVLRRSW